MKNILFAILALYSFSVSAQTDSLRKDKWYDKLSIRGYTQVRYNRLLETNPSLVNEQGDKSIGENGGFFIRRSRIIIYGQVSKRVYIYVQPDLASSPSSDKLHFAQIRDAYFDLSLDDKNEFRFRVGQSKIPYGFENLQSSQNRLSLDRNDALNSAVSNERDLGVMFYWAPKEKRKLLSDLVSQGLKGSGDYGLFGIGLYNGQTANSPEANNTPHIVTRFSYPFQIKSQIIEMSLQGYKGDYVISKSNLSQGVKYKQDLNYKDERVAASFILYPKPFGLQSEFTVGRGPQFNKVTDSIEVKSLQGGYIQSMYMLKVKEHVITPFVKYQWYQGGKKHEKDARSYDVKEFEIGVEWQPMKNFELTVNWTYAERRFEDFSKQNNLQKGSFLRLQTQFNF